MPKKIILSILIIIGLLGFLKPSKGQGSFFDASISISGNEVISEINPFIYGNNLRWLHSGDGVWTGNGLNTSMIAKIKEIKPSMIRFPGGGYVHDYHWSDTIGPKDQRPKGGSKKDTPNDFGVDEFMLFVKEINAEPLITVNTLRGTAKEAAAWVAYMNGRTGNPTEIGVDVNGYDWKNVDYWAGKRAENGHAQPYNVKDWEIGNEDYFFWDANKYYSVFEEFAREMKRVDFSIETGAVAQEKWWRNNAWEKWLGPDDKTNFDFAAYHYYPKSPPYKFETLSSSKGNQSRNFQPIETEAGTYKFKLNLGSSGRGWTCDVLVDGQDLNDNQGQRVIISTPPEGTEWNSWGWYYTNEFELSQASHTFSFHCQSGTGTLYLRDVFLLKDSANRFTYYDELKYNNIEYVSKVLWKTSKQFPDFIRDYKRKIKSPKTKVYITEFNQGGFDMELVDLKNSIFLADTLIQMIKSNNVEAAQYWLISDYHNRWTNLIDFQDFSIIRPNFLVYKLFSNKVSGQLLNTQVNSPTYSVEGANTPYIETITAKNSGKLFITIINKHTTGNARLNIQLNGFSPEKKATVSVLNGPSLDANNETGNNIRIKESQIEITGNNFDYIAEPHSLTIITTEPDTTPPVISNLSSSDISQASATITWQTDEPATSQVEYGPSTLYGKTTSPDSTLITFHSVTLLGLTAETKYHYRIKSKDAPGNEQISNDYTFKTSASTEKTLSVSLSASPSSGVIPLKKVDLTANVSGTASGPINYTFYCARSDNKTNISSDYVKQYKNISYNSKKAMDICDYTSAGAHMAKVIVEREGLTVEARMEINVTDKPSPAQLPYKDGSLIKLAGDAKVYVISDNKRRWIPDETTFNAKGYDWSKINEVEASVLEQYPVGANIAAVAATSPASVSPEPPSTAPILLRTTDSAKVYQIISNKKLWIPTAEAFNNLNLNWQNISLTSQDTLNNYERLKLARAPDSSKVYYLTESGMKRHLLNPEVFLSYGNQWGDIVEIEQKYLDAYPDNILIKLETDNKVYKLEENKKHWIKTLETFQKLGYQWNQVAPVNQTELEAYIEGEAME